MDLGQGREDLDFHGIGSRRQGVRNVEAFSTFRIKGAGPEGNGYNRVVAGEGKEGGTIED